MECILKADVIGWIVKESMRKRGIKNDSWVLIYAVGERWRRLDEHV